MGAELSVRVVLCVVLVGSGLLIAWMAHAAASGKLKRNPVAGIRIPSTMASEEAWLAAHVRAKRATQLSALVAVAAGLIVLLPLPTPALASVALVGAGAMVGFVLYGARVGSRAAEAVTREAAPGSTGTASQP
jgi:uncharacterized membrane protein